ncbi:hypothetical protein HID58_004036 [Brassica napus]|uniref:Ammonium transporter AmtB-like domain-containing protein n=1 Tax=Brassica napus TaxID=3708 RepID=A0ABQ7XIA6_BRANA|nr:hypothetical protein HID58_004036 [Brassica napus]
MGIRNSSSWNHQWFHRREDSVCGLLDILFFLNRICYPVVSHGSGHQTDGPVRSVHQKNRLFGTGAIDFAGSGVVHMVGGIAGLMGALIEGPRRGRFEKSGRAIALRGILLPLCLRDIPPLVRLDGGYDHLAGSTAALTTLFGKRLLSGHWNVTDVCNGLLGGFAAITGVVLWWSRGLRLSVVLWRPRPHRMQQARRDCTIDDPLEAAQLRGDGGTRMRRVGANICYHGNTLFILKKLDLLRISEKDEMAGMDMTRHGGFAYMYYDNDDESHKATQLQRVEP